MRAAEEELRIAREEEADAERIAELEANLEKERAEAEEAQRIAE